MSWRGGFFVISVIAILLLASCSNHSAMQTPPPALALSSFVTGLTLPIGFETPNDGTNRSFVTEQGGEIRIIQNGILLATPFLDVSPEAGFVSGGEEGLIGLTFNPNFASNGKFYAYYTRTQGTQIQSVISEFTASPPNANTASLSTERQLLVIDQPYNNHKGGQMAFGPDDGDLYIALGDGGGEGDPQGNGQNTNKPLAKILRIDVTPSAGQPYTIPPDNPFANGGGAPETFAYGFRNPWRFSFDPAMHRLFAGDVGQNNWEEIDLVTKGNNYGWSVMEGDHCYPPNVTSCNETGLTLPITEYDHGPDGGSAVIGGFVYRGSAIPSLVGTYVYGDLSSGHVWGLQENSNGSWTSTLLLTHNLTVSSFGRDSAGELYLVDYVNGAVLRITGATQ